MTTHDLQTLKGSLRAHRRVNAYIEQLAAECPALPESTLRTWSISASDSVLVHEILDGCSEPVDVLDVGTFLGVSAFMFASHPNVQRVVTIDPNPSIAGEINVTGAQLDTHVDAASLSARHVHDVARAALAPFPEAAAKVEFFEGVLSGEADTGGNGATAARFNMSDLDRAGSKTQLVALVDGLHTADGVYGDLEALLSARPDALVLLDDCRYYWGPFVQSGVGRFLSEHPGKFHFRLLADLSHSFASSQLAVLYASEDGALPAPVGRVVSSVSDMLDPLQVLEREQEVVASASAAFDRDVVEAELRKEQAAQRSLEAELSYLRELSAQSHQRLTGMSGELARLSLELQGARAELDSLRASTSWKLTKPLRRASSLARRLK